MKTKSFPSSLILIVSGCLFISCQKEIDGTVNGSTPPVNIKPKLGTTWTYYYYWYNSPGGMTNGKMVYHTARSEETIGGEKWLKIVDAETDTLVYYLNTKTDGLYQYTNNNSYLLCKYPASINDIYTTFNGGSAEVFTVRAANDTTPTGIGKVPLNKYEGTKTTPIGTQIIEVLWYNNNAWILWKYQYILTYLQPGQYYYWLKSKMFIDNIVY